MKPMVVFENICFHPVFLYTSCNQCHGKCRTVSMTSHKVINFFSKTCYCQLDTENIRLHPLPPLNIFITYPKNGVIAFGSQPNYRCCTLVPLSQQGTFTIPMYQTKSTESDLFLEEYTKYTKSIEPI